MTLLCVAAEPGIPGVRRCTIRGEHLVSCDSDTCTGCAPREARFGTLCAGHWFDLEHALTDWAVLEDYLEQFDRLKPQERSGGAGQPGSRVPLPQTRLDADEVRSWLIGAPNTAAEWVSSIEGGIRAVQFTGAVQRAMRAHPIEEKPRRLQRMRCECGALVVWMPPTHEGGALTVPCTQCGRIITEDERWTSYRKTADGWEQYQEPAVDVIAGIETWRKPRKGA